VDNTSDANKPVSTAQATALGLKADKSGTLAQFASTTSSQLLGVLSDETGTGVAVFNNAPSLVSPVISGSATAPTQANTDTSTLLATTAHVKSLNLGQFASTTSAQLAAAISDETGTGVFVRNVSPAINAPVITGVADGSNAGAGIVGEYVTANASGVSLTSGVSVNATSISLTAGDWDVSGVVVYSPAGTTILQLQYGGVSTTSASLGAFQYALYNNNNTNAGAGGAITTPTVRVSVAATTTVYLVAQGVFTTSTCTVAGLIRARRIR
jgi:hypothetical protein